MKAVALALCGLLLGQLASAGDLAKEVLFNLRARDFTHKLQGKVLPGWIVIYEDRAQSIKITRDRSVMSYLVAPNLGAKEPQELAWPSFSFKVMPLVSREEYRRQKAENDVIKKKLAALRNRASVEGIVIPDDQAKVDEYLREEKSLHHLPDGYSQDLSFLWQTPQPLWSSGVVPRDEYVRKEGETVFQQVNAAFFKY